MVPTNIEQVTVCSNTRVVGAGFTKFAADFKAALKSGSPFVEAIQIAQAALIDVVPVLSSIPAVTEDIAQDLPDELTTAFLVGRDFLKAIKS